MSAGTLPTTRNIFTRTRGRTRLHPTDLLAYLWLLFGTIVMFGPVFLGADVLLQNPGGPD